MLPQVVFKYKYRFNFNSDSYLFSNFTHTRMCLHIRSQICDMGKSITDNKDNDIYAKRRIEAITCVQVVVHRLESVSLVSLR